MTDHITNPSEPDVLYAAVRRAEDELHIECRFSDGQKFAAVTVDGRFGQLAHQIADALTLDRSSVRAGYIDPDKVRQALLRIGSPAGAEGADIDQLVNSLAAAVIAYFDRVDPAQTLTGRLPSDVKVGHVTFAQGAKLDALIEHAQQLDALAHPEASEDDIQAWEVSQGARKFLVPRAEFVNRSFDYGSFRPLVYGDVPRPHGCELPGLLTRTHEDHGVVVCRFDSESSAARFMTDYSPSVEGGTEAWAKAHGVALDDGETSSVHISCGHCHTCDPVTLENMRMVVCAHCGNKRCPRANDCRNPCTNSNEPNQPGAHGTPSGPPAGDVLDRARSLFRQSLQNPGVSVFIPEDIKCHMRAFMEGKPSAFDGVSSTPAVQSSPQGETP